MNKSEIHCTNEKDFFDAIAALVMRGILFKAYTAEMRIVLTGGY